MTRPPVVIVRPKQPSKERHMPSAITESPVIKWTLIGIALTFLFFFLVTPLVAVFLEAFRKGAFVYFASFTDSDALHAIQLTLLVAVIAVPLNTIFGLAAAWAITKFRFRGKQVLITLIDLPFAVSPVIAGLVFVLIFSTSHGWMAPVLNNSVAGLLQLLPLIGGLGSWLTAQQPTLESLHLGWLLSTWDIKIIFNTPGLVLATIFVTFPFVARELIPLMQAQGSDEELAAITLGASGWQTFWRVTVPNIKWGLIHGIILCNARAMGEFGAVSVVSGHIRGQTTTMPLHIEILYNDYKFSAAFAMASLLTLLGLVTLLIKTIIERNLLNKAAR